MSASLRSTIKHFGAGVLHACGLSQWRAFAGRAGQVCVLGLHRVLDPAQMQRAHSQPGIVLAESNFAALLEYLGRRFRFVTMDEFLDQGGNGSKPGCLLTFDDGWRDNYLTAFPLLKRMGVPATIFVATGFLSGDTVFWVERLKRACRDPQALALAQKSVAHARTPASDIEQIIESLKRRPAADRERVLEAVLPRTQYDNPGDKMMTWDEAAEMSRAGVDFGAHTVTHPLLPFEDDVSVEREVSESKRQIESAIGRRVRSFAYPNGDWDDRVRGIVARSGYDCAFTTRRGWFRPGGDRFTVSRFLLHDGNVAAPDGRFSPAILDFGLARWY